MKHFVFLFFTLSSFNAFADTIYVAPVQGTNVTEQQTKTLRELIKVEVQNDSKHNVVDSLDQAQYFIQTKVIKFNNFTLSITKWQGNKKVSTGQWKANSLADFESQISTAVPEVLNTENNSKKAVLFENNKSLGEQAAEKKRKSNFERVEARRQVSIGFGPAYFTNMNSTGTGLGFQAGYVWNIDDHFDLGLSSDFAISTERSKSYLFTGKIFTNYYFNTNDISPFVGAGFGYGFASVDDANTGGLQDDSAAGFAMGLQAGVKFFRTSTVNFAISGEYTNIFDKSSLGQPGAFILRVSLLY